LQSARSRRSIAGRALPLAGLLIGGAVVALGPLSRHAFAEFEIPEVDGEKGTWEIEYRGAGHWGLPGPSGPDDDIDALKQSHEVEIQYAITDYWMFRVTPDFEQPAGEDLTLTTVGVETQAVLVPRKGGPFGLALMLGYEPVTDYVDIDEPDQLEFGPIIELASGRFLFTLNPNLVDQLGKFADQEWLGLEYATQLEYRFAPHWSVAALAFGELEDLANAGNPDDQQHVAGAGFYWFSKAADGEVLRAGEKESGEEDESGWSVGLGGLLGLTSASPDVSLRATLRMEF
jgi:hypothetical protein